MKFISTILLLVALSAAAGVGTGLALRLYSLAAAFSAADRASSTLLFPATVRPETLIPHP